LIATVIEASHPQDAASARAWRDANLAAVCDVVEPWEHGRILRATRYPTYWDLNCVLVEDTAPVGGEEVRAVADRALEGLAHRRISFDHLENAEPLRAEFKAAGWMAMRLVWLRHQGAATRAPGAVEIAEVRIDAVHELRFAWHHEEFENADGLSFGAFLDDALAVAERFRGARVFAAIEDGEPVGFVQLERIGSSGEIAQAFVRRDRRGGGLGAALLATAIAEAQELAELYICADDEDRAKDLYERMGFRPVWRTMDFLLPPRL
jgi:GNAT superfamily N-acetyltransferase